ncbi:FecCD family ABC transporter permease [Longirhabdus pacifica]|uniref:FecCD family ABC transporter permease n=1 Tax=Longirhabdus pacifica TaxID=2305227 RepID=UPI00352202CA
MEKNMQPKNSSTYSERTKQIHVRPKTAMMTMSIGMAAIVFTLGVSIAVGAADINLVTVWNAIFHFDANMVQHDVIRELRIPRSLADIVVGASFAVAGAVMQGMTRNPLADSGLLGINAGAVFMISICFAFLPQASYSTLMMFSFIGAAFATTLVYGSSALSKGGATPVRLVLAGAAVTALLTALSEGIAIQFRLSQDIAYWFAAGVAGVNMDQLTMVVPWVIVAFVGAMMLSRSITLLSMGDEVATGLGQRTGMIKLLGSIIVLLLAGTAVSLAGPIMFVGLVIPHIARFIVGVDYRWIIPCSAILGALLMLFADIGARMINPPYETPISALFALIGVPFFLFVARKQRREL